MRLSVKWMLSSCLGVAVLMPLPGLTHAAELPARGLVVSPITQDLSLAPGSSTKGTIKITSTSSESAEFTLQAVNFTAKGDTGEASFSVPGKDDDEPYSMAKWLRFDAPKVTIAPAQTKEVGYTVVVPANAEPGGHYGAALFASSLGKDGQPAGPESKVTVTQRVGTLLLIRVEGAIVEKVTVTDFKPEHFINLHLPIGLSYRVHNEGAIHVRPRGEITVKSWRGKTTSLTINQGQGAILPQSQRLFQQDFTPGPWDIGPFTATLVLIYGNNQSVISTASFWYVPFWVVYVLIGLVALIIFGNFLRKRINISLK